MAFINQMIMQKIPFIQKNNLIVRYKSSKHFFKDLELFKKYFSGHPFINELTRANQFSYERLDGQMLIYLLDVLSIEDILENRNQEKVYKNPTRTQDEIKDLLLENNIYIEEKDCEILSEIMPSFSNKTDEDIVDLAKKLLNKEVQEPLNLDDSNDESISEDNKSVNPTSSDPTTEEVSTDNTVPKQIQTKKKEQKGKSSPK